MSCVSVLAILDLLTTVFDRKQTCKAGVGAVTIGELLVILNLMLRLERQPPSLRPGVWAVIAVCWLAWPQVQYPVQHTEEYI